MTIDGQLLLGQDCGCGGATGIKHFGDAVFGGGQGREGGVGFGLVPVGYGVEIIGAVVGVAMLDGDLDGFVESDGAFRVPTVEAIAATDALGIDHVGAVVLVAEGLQAEVPGAVVIVL